MGINIAIIPARGGSKGIPRKNIKQLAGKPLVAWSIEASKESKYIDKVVVSTEDSEISDVALKYGADVYDRPKDLAGDSVHSVYVVLDYLSYCKKEGIIIDRVSMILPTSPIRTATDIDGAFDIFNKYVCDSVVSVCKYDKPISSLRKKSGFLLEPVVSVGCFETQRQDIKQQLFEVNGSIYISTPEHLDKTKSFHKGNVCPYIMGKINSIDINKIEDFEIAEAILCQRLYGI